MAKNLLKKIGNIVINDLNEGMKAHFQVDAIYTFRAIEYNLKTHKKLTWAYIDK